MLHHDVCKHYLNCAKLVFLYMSFKQPTSQFNLRGIKMYSCYKLSPAPPLIVSVAATLCWGLGKLFNFLTTSVPSLYTRWKHLSAPFCHTPALFSSQLQEKNELQIAGSWEVLPRTESLYSFHDITFVL